MSNPGDPRGTSTDPPQWWIDEFQAAYERHRAESKKGSSQVALGKTLAILAGRPTPWNHSVVSNFISGERYTLEMAIGFSLLYEMPMYEVTIRSETREQALEVQVFVEKLAARHGGKRPDRVLAVDAAAFRLLGASNDQSDGVTSMVHEGSSRSGRTRRTTRRGPKAP